MPRVKSKRPRVPRQRVNPKSERKTKRKQTQNEARTQRKKAMVKSKKNRQSDNLLLTSLKSLNLNKFPALQSKLNSSPQRMLSSSPQRMSHSSPQRMSHSRLQSMPHTTYKYSKPYSSSYKDYNYTSKHTSSYASSYNYKSSSVTKYSSQTNKSVDKITQSNSFVISLKEDKVKPFKGEPYKSTSLYLRLNESDSDSDSDSDNNTLFVNMDINHKTNTLHVDNVDMGNLKGKYLCNAVMLYSMILILNHYIKSKGSSLKDIKCRIVVASKNESTAHKCYSNVLDMLGFQKQLSENKNKNLLLYKLSNNGQSLKPFNQVFEYKKNNLNLQISKDGIIEK